MSIKYGALGFVTAIAINKTYKWYQTRTAQTPVRNTTTSLERKNTTRFERKEKKNEPMQIDESGDNSAIKIAKPPEKYSGVPRVSNFKVVPCEVPELKDGEFLVKSLFISVDPYLRGRIAQFKENNVPSSGAVAEVVKSKAKGILVGEKIFNYLPWKKLNVIDLTKKNENGSDHLTKHFRKVSDDIKCSTALGVAGMPGFTAYVGLLYVAELKKEDTTVFVSGAAGAVGSVVGQIAKIKDCFVVGTCGSAEKCAYLTEELGFDVAINYKEYDSAKKMREVIEKKCEHGIDVYFDNTGGHVTEAVITHLNKFARVAICGQIAYYNSTEIAKCEAFLSETIYKCITIKGFMVYEYIQYQEAFLRDISNWIKTEQLKYKETIYEGFNQVPQAFIDLFSGKNLGKMIVKV